MIKVFLTANLQKYYPVSQFEVDARSVTHLLQLMDQERPRFSTYIIDEAGNARKHVNIFVDGALVPKTDLNRALTAGNEVHIMQALSGG